MPPLHVGGVVMNQGQADKLCEAVHLLASGKAYRRDELAANIHELIQAQVTPDEAEQVEPDECGIFDRTRAWLGGLYGPEVNWNADIKRVLRWHMLDRGDAYAKGRAYATPDEPDKGAAVKVRIAWMAAAREVNKAYAAILDDGERVSHRLHDAICDLRRLELATPVTVKGC